MNRTKTDKRTQTANHGNPYIMVVLSLLLLLAGCESGAVVFAPTPPPPDLSPLRYTHPSGSFSVIVPRTWPVYEQNMTTLATAAFAPPGEDDPAVLFTVMNVEGSAPFSSLIDQYQTQLRPDLERYTEQNRQAMGDGSWRITGLRRSAVGVTQQVNTFIEQTGALLGIAEVVLPSSPGRMQELQAIINTFEINPDAPLDAASLSSLTLANSTGLTFLHVATWSTASGVFFITGEVANYGSTLVTDVPLRGVLRTPDGLSVAEAIDTVMGYGIPPGGFAPFSLRFGQGQPSLTNRYELALGGADWVSNPDALIYGAEALAWTDDSTLEPDGRLMITGTVTNISAETVNGIRVIATVFNEEQNVIAAGFYDLSPGELAPGATADFQLVVPEMGGQPTNYIINVQGRA